MISKQQGLLILLVLLLVLRAVFAAMLPLSADEAYYWLWSKHLAAGYYDHPPAIAWLIAPGTWLLGDGAIGVRLAGVLLSLPVTWLVWDSARLLLKDGTRALLAALIFNLTLMVSVEMLAATPDMASVATAAGFFWALARVRETARPHWWLVVGVMAGLGLLAKLSALFLGLGALFWLLADRQQRRWLATPWPWAGALLALLLFAPNLWWQSQHQWQTFAFQFGRVSHGHMTARYLGEFLAAQIGLATPLIFVLMLAGLWAGRKPGTPLFLPVMLAVPAILYFLIHALHDRVQGNWPCFLYPMLAVLAGAAFSRSGARWRGWTSAAALPLAGLLLALAYAQAGWGVVPIANDPAARILGRPFQKAAARVAALSDARQADAILTTDYETTAWLRFQAPGVKVIQVNEAYRYPAAPAPTAQLLAGRLYYLTAVKRDRHGLVAEDFARVGRPLPIPGPVPGASYLLYPVSGPKREDLGRMP